MEHSPLFGGKGPPCNVEAEQAFLGALLANSRRVFDLIDDVGLLPEHFADPIHGVIFRECLALHACGAGADAVMLKSRLEHSGALGEVGGTPYLTQLLTAMVGIINARDYAMEIRRTWQQRQLIDLGLTIPDLARNVQDWPDPAKLAGEIAAKAEEISIGATALTANRVSASAAMTNALRQVEETQLSGLLPGIATGIASMDRRTGGLKKKLLYGLGGRTGTGKTGLAQTIARNVAMGDKQATPPRTPKRVLYLAMEMSTEEMGLRDLSALSRIPADRLQVGNVNVAECAKLMTTAKAFGDPPLLYDDTMALSPREVDLKVRYARKEGDVDLVIVDHLHLMRPNDEHARLDRTQQLGMIINGLLKVARDRNVAMLVLVQLNRETDKRENKRPTLVDIRQCGTVEETCHAVMFIYRADYYPSQEEVTYDFGAPAEAPDPDRPVPAELIWAKNRGGAPGTDHVFFHGPTTSFLEFYEP